MIKCVIFDFDGVIADSHSMFNKLFTRIANEELDLGITNEEFAQFPGMRFELRLSYLAKQKGIDVSQENLDKAIAKGRNEYHESTSSFTTLYEGAKEFLQELRNNSDFCFDQFSDLMSERRMRKKKKKMMRVRKRKNRKIYLLNYQQIFL